MGRAGSAPPRWRRDGDIATAVAVLTVIGMAAAYATAMVPTVTTPGPDLSPQVATLSPIPTFEGDILEVSVTIVNLGDMAAVAATVDVTDARPGGSVIAIGQVSIPEPISPGGSVVIRAPKFLAVGVGEHTLTFTVANVSPAETNGANDALSIRVAVEPARSPPPPPPPSGIVRIEAIEALGLGALLTLAILALVIAMTIVLAGRSPPALEPPPPEPPDRSPPPIWPP